MNSESTSQIWVALCRFLLSNGHVMGTLMLLSDSEIRDNEVPELLSFIDEVLLPDASLGDGKLSFTVVRGKSLGAFVAGATGE